MIHVPPLRTGDRLHRQEFERRYDATLGLKKAELIRGVAFVPGSVPACVGHARFDLIGWLGRYEDHCASIEGGANPSIRLNDDNELQPDICLFRRGPERIDQEGYLCWAPELVGDVLDTVTGVPMLAKLKAYAEFGTREYIVWRVLDRAIDWFILRGENFERLPLGPDGLFRSAVFPGLWLDPAAMAAGDRQGVVKAVEAGINASR